MAKDTETSDTGVAVNDAYTGLLAISLIALLVGSLLLFLDYSQHSGTPPPVRSIPKFEAPKNPPPQEKQPVIEKKDDGKEAAKEAPKEAAKENNEGKDNKAGAEK
jgi:hypothetical protein